MNKKGAAAEGAFGGMFVIGLVFFVIGLSTGTWAFVPIGLVFPAVAIGGRAAPRRKPATNQNPEDKSAPVAWKKDHGG